MGHRVQKWDTQQAVKDCSSHSRKLAECPSADVEPSPDGIKKIKEFCSEVQSLLIAKFRGASVPVGDKVPFHECVQELFGELDISGTHDLSGTENAAHLEGVSQQILKLATDGDTDGFSNHSLSRGIGTRKTVDAFTRSPRHFADSIWESIRLKQEKILEPTTSAPLVPSAPPAPFAGKSLNLHSTCKIEITAPGNRTQAFQFHVWRVCMNAVPKICSQPIPSLPTTFLPPIFLSI